jgi:antitoxin component of RelBE/YafQ-DinJ toxin-antitoxin module
MSTSSRNDRRLNLRLNSDLVEWSLSYCTRTGISLSGLVRMLLIQLRETEEGERTKHVDAEQI